MKKTVAMSAAVSAAGMLLCLAGCMPAYTLVTPGHASVANGRIKVDPGMAWNKAPKGAYDVAGEENWTENGPLLDSIGFIGGLLDGQAITKQRPKDDRQVPVFRSTMSPQDLVLMVESYYRIKAGAATFETTGVQPVTFLGKPGLRFDFAYVGHDEVRRRGRAILGIVGGKLYMMTLDAAALHYFDAALPDFERMAAGATAG